MSQRVLRLSDNETLRFLDLNQNEPVLYNATLEEYRDRDLRAAVAKRISAALHIFGFGPAEMLVKLKT
jgi:hypothetical protein